MNFLEQLSRPQIGGPQASWNASFDAHQEEMRKAALLKQGQENLLASQQQRQQQAELHPLALQEKQLGLETRKLQNTQIKQTIDKENYIQAMDEMLRIPHESLEGLARISQIMTRYGIPENHPAFAAAVQAHARGPEQFEAFKNYVATGGAQSREQRVREAALEERQQAKDKAALNRTLAKEAEITKRALEVARINAERALALARDRVQDIKVPNLQQLAARYLTEIEQLRDGIKQAQTQEEAAQYNQILEARIAALNDLYKYQVALLQASPAASKAGRVDAATVANLPTTPGIPQEAPVRQAPGTQEKSRDFKEEEQAKLWLLNNKDNADPVTKRKMEAVAKALGFSSAKDFFTRHGSGTIKR